MPFLSWHKSHYYLSRCLNVLSQHRVSVRMALSADCSYSRVERTTSDDVRTACDVTSARASRDTYHRAFDHKFHDGVNDLDYYVNYDAADFAADCAADYNAGTGDYVAGGY